MTNLDNLYTKKYVQEKDEGLLKISLLLKNQL